MYIPNDAKSTERKQLTRILGRKEVKQSPSVQVTEILKLLWPDITTKVLIKEVSRGDKSLNIWVPSKTRRWVQILLVVCIVALTV